MAKNPLITDEVRKVIANIYLEHPKWRAKEIQGAVEARLHEINPRYKAGWPGLSAVQKELTKIRKADDARPPELKALDRPWSIGALVEYPLPPESLPIVLRAFYAERRTDVKTDEYFRIGYEYGHETYLTIRVALWISRLSALFKYPVPSVSGYTKFNLVTSQLVRWAQRYALAEKTAEILEKPLDTSNFDIGFYTYARKEIYPALVSFPSLKMYSWEATLNQLKKEAQNEG